MDLIDIAVTREQFDAFDAEVVESLCEATWSDLEKWSGRLLAASARGDIDEILRARHALKGICGIYGANVLIALSAGPLMEANARAQFTSCVSETFSAILAVAASRGTI